MTFKKVTEGIKNQNDTLHNSNFIFTVKSLKYKSCPTSNLIQEDSNEPYFYQFLKDSFTYANILC